MPTVLPSYMCLPLIIKTWKLTLSSTQEIGKKQPMYYIKLDLITNHVKPSYVRLPPDLSHVVINWCDSGSMSNEFTFLCSLLQDCQGKITLSQLDSFK